jgi:hypothetical protein
MIMKTTTHTPGAWKANKWATGFEVGAVDAHYTVCLLRDCNNAESNARLIAAAPDLLEACEAILQAFKCLTLSIESCDLTESEDQAVGMAEAAISKATA